MVVPRIALCHVRRILTEVAIARCREILLATTAPCRVLSVATNDPCPDRKRMEVEAPSLSTTLLTTAVHHTRVRIIRITLVLGRTRPAKRGRDTPTEVTTKGRINHIQRQWAGEKSAHVAWPGESLLIVVKPNYTNNLPHGA
jgi:hypothetical protein